jgi:zinc transporter ZupT
MLHSLIDGLAIGVFKEASEMLVLSLSVIIHKVPVACTVGTTFKSNGQPLKKFSTLFIFILFMLASPLGMLLGMILGEVSSSIGLVIVQGFSGGTFIYLACCDLLIHEFHNDHADGNDKASNCGKFTMILLGSAIVGTLIALAPAHQH